MKLSVVVPLWNEGGNVPALVEMMAQSSLVSAGELQLILVNNGSDDDTGSLVDQAAERYPWIVPVQLPANLNYGGGIYEGARHASHPHVGFLPGDLQYTAADLACVWNDYKTQSDSKCLAKGWRTRRLDPWSTRVVSVLYTWIANLLLGTSVHDINGLPKIFGRALFDALPAERMTTFVLDAQLLFVATRLGWTIKETPVTFHARRAGVSSWSGRRIRVYLRSLGQLLAVRRLAKAPGVRMMPAPDSRQKQSRCL